MKARKYIACLLLSVLLPLLSVLAETSDQAHQSLLAESKDPSASDCATCHPVQFKEWSASPHAYAQISPVFNAMNATLLKLSNGTLGDFCIRCHTPVGMDNGEPLVASNFDRAPISVEGVTCITCHRRSEEVGKASGRFAISHGEITSAVYGPSGNEELRRVLASKEYEVSSDPNSDGRKVHRDAVHMPQITTSAYCGSCHDVNGASGFRLEEAFSEYQSSPAASEKISCQDCHMGSKPGINAGYTIMPAAIVGGKATKPRKHANHRFVGPDYSIVHPGIFPHNPEAKRFATMKEWIAFDYQAGWGTEEFEDAVESNDEYEFPERWQSVSDRFEARDYLEANQELLRTVAEERLLLLREGYKLGEIKIEPANSSELEFSVEVKNGTVGHNVPTGFDAERLVFLRVTVTDARGETLFLSGNLDPNGDLLDSHSQYVHDGKLPRDEQLFSLQSKFLVTLIRGGEREQVLNVNQSLSPLPFIRPPTSATLLTGRAPDARKHRQTIPPNGSMTARYAVEKDKLSAAVTPLRLKVELVAGMVPVNLVIAIKDVGFDFGMSPREVADAVVKGHQVLWSEEREIPFVPEEQ
jgi:nitrate/TMAO reductase-like tetraheme cytochrome c subunit